MPTEHPVSSSPSSARWLRFGVIGAAVVAVVALTSWCAAAHLNDDGAPSDPDGAQTATPATSPAATGTTAATASPTGTATAAASPTVATATTSPETPAQAATATAPPTSTTAPAQPTWTPTSTTAPVQPTATPTNTTAPAQPTATPTPVVLANRTVTYNFSMNAFASTLTLNFNFTAGTVTGTLSGTRTEVVTNTCYSGGQLLETAEAAATDTFSSTLSATIAPTGGHLFVSSGHQRHHNLRHHEAVHPSELPQRQPGTGAGAVRRLRQRLGRCAGGWPALVQRENDRWELLAIEAPAPYAARNPRVSHR